MVKHGDLGASDVETVGAITGRIGSDYATRRCGVCVRDGYWRACTSTYDMIGSANRMLHNLPLRQCLEPNPSVWSATTTAVGSGSCGSRPVLFASRQLATLTTRAAISPSSAPPVGSTILRPLLSRKNVCSPKIWLKSGTAG